MYVRLFFQNFRFFMNLSKLSTWEVFNRNSTAGYHQQVNRKFQSNCLYVKVFTLNLTIHFESYNSLWGYSRVRLSCDIHFGFQRRRQKFITWIIFIIHIYRNYNSITWITIKTWISYTLQLSLVRIKAAS